MPDHCFNLVLESGQVWQCSTRWFELSVAKPAVWGLLTVNALREGFTGLDPCLANMQISDRSLLVSPTLSNKSATSVGSNVAHEYWTQDTNRTLLRDSGYNLEWLDMSPEALSWSPNLLYALPRLV